jgi:head-tail adaptor
VTIPLAGLRALASGAFALPDTCTVQRYTETPSGDGTSQSWSNLATGVACRVSPLAASANEALGADQSIQAIAQWTVWVPYGQDVTAKDRVVYGSRTFEVQRVGARSYEVVRELICLEIT